MMTASDPMATISVFRRLPVYKPYLYRFRKLVEGVLNKPKYFRAMARASKSTAPTTLRSSSFQPSEFGSGLCRGEQDRVAFSRVRASRSLSLFSGIFTRSEDSI